MKLSDAILDMPPTGICQIDTKRVIKCFGKSMITKYKNSYYLVNQRAHVKVAISYQDARTLIDSLGLLEMKSFIFTNASTFRKYDEEN